jgi:hypothetical protein
MLRAEAGSSFCSHNFGNMPTVTPNVRGRHFQFTLNNYTDEDLVYLRYLGSDEGRLSNHIAYIAWGFEVAPTTGTPHLQGAIGFTQRRYHNQVALTFQDLSPFISLARNKLANYRYAIKGGDFEEYGNVPSNNAGGRADLERFQADVRSGMRLRDIRDNHYAAYTRNTGAARELILQYMRSPVPQIHPLREWQSDLYGLLQLPVCDRTIHFVVDYWGNQGKTWFAKYYTWMRSLEDDVLTIRPTKRENMAYIFTDALLERHLRTIFVDCSRDIVDHLNYGFFEELKDGCVCSGKYGSRMVHFEPVHVIVLMNSDPDLSKLSADRPKVWHLQNPA